MKCSVSERHRWAVVGSSLSDCLRTPCTRVTQLLVITFFSDGGDDWVDFKRRRPANADLRSLRRGAAPNYGCSLLVFESYGLGALFVMDRRGLQYGIRRYAH